MPFAERCEVHRPDVCVPLPQKVRHQMSADKSPGAANQYLSRVHTGACQAAKLGPSKIYSSPFLWPAMTPIENLLAGSARLCFTWRGTTTVKIKTVKSSKITGRRPPGTFSSQAGIKAHTQSEFSNTTAPDLL